MGLDFNDFDSVEKFIAEYKSSVAILKELDIILTNINHYIQFIYKANKHLPVWADRYSY